VDVSTDVDTASPNPGTPAPASDAGEPKQRRRRSGPMVISGQIDMPGGVRLTGRDYQLLAFLGRYKVATVTQIARYFKTSESAMRNRLPRLERAGLLGWAYTGQAKPKAWTVTETGLKVASVALSAPHIKWGTLRHTFGLVDLGITFEHADETVVTEREIRAAARDVPTSGAPKTSPTYHRMGKKKPATPPTPTSSPSKDANSGTSPTWSSPDPPTPPAPPDSSPSNSNYTAKTLKIPQMQ
jgi:Transcriptional regulators